MDINIFFEFYKLTLTLPIQLLAIKNDFDDKNMMII